MGAHSDVLSASIPSSPDSRRALVEEIKRRGRVCVMSRNYPDADALYGKGIEVLLASSSPDDDVEGNADKSQNEKELAILYANRSLARMQMGKVAESLEDADAAVTRDPSYVKGHWRRGQASAGCGNSEEALRSFENALELEPGNKALKKEVQSARERVERERRSREEAEEAAAAAKEKEKDEDGDAKIKDAAPPKATAKKTATTAAKKTEKAESSSAVKDAADGSLFTKSDHVRGYKIRSDGKKTSYFDREIDEDAKRLIGDIAPKKLGEENGGSGPRPIDATGAAAEGTSAWNTAGTWEERDVTPWANGTLSAALLAAEYVLPPGSPSPGARATVTKISKIDGHASFATVRGKKRYMYEFSITIEWALTMGDDHSRVCHGEMTFPDVDGTVELGEGYDIANYRVDGGSAAGTGHLLDRFVRDGGLRDAMHGAIDDWVTSFRAAY